MRLETAGDVRGRRAVWVDARFGVAGDMLLAALLDAGASLETVRRDVEAVVPESVALAVSQVRRGAMRATRLEVERLDTDQPRRSWRDVRALLEAADVPDRVRRHALLAFAALAEAEAHVHGVPVEEVHFHEVGAWDSIADVVGVCSALEDLGVGMLFISEIALGHGFVRGAHGLMPVPVPAVLELVSRNGELVRGLPAVGRAAASEPGAQSATEAEAEQAGELATPTGVALLVALADGGGGGGIMTGTYGAVGVGAGTRDDLPWPNIVRVALSPAEPEAERRWDDELVLEYLWVLEANVDDLDPRAWPSVLEGLLERGALDAWLTPVAMKKGRAGHTVSALVDHEHESAVREHLFRATSTFGVRSSSAHRVSLARTWHPLEVGCAGTTARVRIKLGHRRGEIVRATPEYEDAAALARQAGRPVADALAAAAAAAHAAGLRPGEPLPDPADRPSDR